MTNEKFIDCVETSRTITKGGFSALRLVSKIGETILVNGATNFACEKFGITKWKKLCVKVFTSLALTPAIEDKVIGYTFGKYEKDVDYICDAFISACKKSEDDEDEKADEEFEEESVENADELQ